MGCEVCYCVWGKGQVKETFFKGCNWSGWTERQQEVAPKRRGTRVKCSCTCTGLDLRDRQADSFLWSVNGKGVMAQAWSEDKQAVLHKAFCMSTGCLTQSILYVNRLILNNFTGNQWRERTSGTLRVNGGDFATTWDSRFWVRWSLARSVSAIPYKSELQ